MSFINQNSVSVYSQNAGITQITKGAYFSASAPGTNTLNGPFGPFRLGNFILTAAGALYYLQSLTTSAGVTTATWTLIQTSGGGGGGILPVPNGGTGVPTLTGIPLFAGTAAATALTYVAPTAWVPNLQINGSNTGITYTTQIGSYTRIANLVFISANITLSSKGVGTGNVTISNLPIATGPNGTSNNIPVNISQATLTANYTSVFGDFANSSAVLSLFEQGTAGVFTAALTDAMIVDGSTFQFAGTYLIN